MLRRDSSIVDAMGMRDKGIRQFHKCEQIEGRKLDMKSSVKTVGLFHEIKNLF